jgi:hypothetical protein
MGTLCVLRKEQTLNPWHRDVTTASRRLRTHKQKLQTFLKSVWDGGEESVWRFNRFDAGQTALGDRHIHEYVITGCPNVMARDKYCHYRDRNQFLELVAKHFVHWAILTRLLIHNNHATICYEYYSGYLLPCRLRYQVRPKYWYIQGVSGEKVHILGVIVWVILTKKFIWTYI